MSKSITLNTSKAKKTQAVKVLTPKEKEARIAKFQASPYNQKVNVTHRATKDYMKTIYGSVETLLGAKNKKSSKLTPSFVAILKHTKKANSKVKVHMMANVRAYGSGTYGTHTVLQWLYKFEEELKDMMK